MGQRIPFPGFVGSAFNAQSRRHESQDLWNWYLARANSAHAKSGQALLPCPGLEPWLTLPEAPVRGLFAQNDKAFAVAGQHLYELRWDGSPPIRRDMTEIGNPAQPTVTTSPLAPPISQPSAPVLTHGGTPGSTTYGYQITALDTFGETTPSVEGTSAVGPATLSGTNWNIVSWSAVEGAVSYKVYRTTGGTVPTAS